MRPTQSNVTYPCVGIDWCELRITFFILRDIKKRGQQQSRCSRCILLHNICYRIDRSIILRSQIIVELSLSSLYFCGENIVPLSTRVCVRAPGLKNNAGIYCLAINPLAQPAIANVSITCQITFLYAVSVIPFSHTVLLLLLHQILLYNSYCSIVFWDSRR